MDSVVNFLVETEIYFVEIATVICDLIGVMVLLATVIRSMINYFHREGHTKLVLARGIGLALEFKLAGEVLRTVTVRTLNELMILGTIILLRAAISFLLHWEMKSDRVTVLKGSDNDTEPHL